MAAGNEDSTLVANYMFHGIEYIITISWDKPDVLIIEVEDRLTTDQWSGSFDAGYIEDLTHKTGNYKEFHIFCNMLETAITKASETVSLDFLTYADLDTLRSRRVNNNRSMSAAPNSKTYESKRYMILTYTVEFDRIHYPLPLLYQGKPDPRVLKETIRHLKSELKRNRHVGSSDVPDLRVKELDKLRKAYEQLRKEKDSLEEEFQDLQSEMKASSKGIKLRDVRALKTMVRNLEEELAKQKTKHQRTNSKLNEEYKSLISENDELVASERNLRIRVKSLTNELAMYKRRVTLSPVPGPRSSSRERRSVSRERSVPRERSTSKERRPRPSPYNRERSSSQERQRPVSSMSGRRSRTPSPSPAGCRAPRFDPTAYIKEKDRRQKESEKKKVRYVRSGSVERRTRPFSSSPGYLRSYERPKKPRSRTSSVGSQSDAGSDSSITRRRNRSKILKGRTSTSSYWSSPDVPLKKLQNSNRGNRCNSSTSTPANPAVLNDISRTKSKKENHHPKLTKADPVNKSMDLSDIEGRLTRLQQFLKSNMPRT